MGLLSDETRDNLRAIHGDALGLAVTLRRDVGAAPPAAQPAILRLFGGEQARTRTTEGGREARVTAELRGRPTMDVQPGDRFTYGDTLFSVVFVNPERDVVTVADLEVGQ